MHLPISIDIPITSQRAGKYYITMADRNKQVRQYAAEKAIPDREENKAQRGKI